MKKKITPSQVLTDDNFLSALEFNDTLSVYLVYQGTDKLKYYAFLDGKLLFEGDEYRPSPLFGIESIESLVGLLFFLTVQEGDTDRDYFANYTPEQLEWSKSRKCEELKMFVSDYEDSTNEYYEQVKEYFMNAYTTA